MSEALTGLSATVTQTVTVEMLAKNVGSGTVSVFSTPELVLLLEKTALVALDGKLEAGKTTVGSGLDVTHLAATPLGMTVKCTVKVMSVDGRKLTFEVAAEDEQESIAKGTHIRFIVDAEKFQARADAKLNTD
ncbi:MAG: thioesterase family protein [Gammaproteobacteria bacterium]|nr:thioesterase family protein [Gammaproteobacteria bacterium]